MSRLGSVPPDAGNAAASADLDAVVAYLARKGDSRGVVLLVERWISAGQATRAGRLHLIRALLDLRLMDRAWVRLREALDADGDDLDAVVLAAEMFVARGWPVRARKILEEPSIHHPENAALRDWLQRASEPPRQPPANARDIERDGTPDQLIKLAEDFLATGSFLRARAILEKLKVQLPDHQRVGDLLWGLKGEFDSSDLAPDLLARKLAPEFHPEPVTGRRDPADAPPLEVTATGLEGPDQEAKEAEFPALFRSYVPPPLPPSDEDTAEVTSKVKMATPEQMRSLGPADDADLPMRHEDTEIMMVIQGSSPSAVSAEAQVHKTRNQEYNLKETLDLAAWRKHMGMDADIDPTTDEKAGKDFLEEEDDNLVVVTRRESASQKSRKTAPSEDAPPRAPIKVIEKHPAPPVEASTTALPPRLRDQATERLPQPGRRRRRLLAAAIGVLAGGFLAVLVVAGVAWFRFLSPDARLLSLTTAVTLSDDYDAILATRKDLEARLSEDPDDARVAAALARLQVLLWNEYSGDLQDLTRARDLVRIAREGRPKARLTDLAVVELALVEKRAADARAALDHLGTGGAAAWLDTAMLAALEGHLDEATEAAKKADRAAPDALRPRRVLATLHLLAGRETEAGTLADALVTAAPQNLQARIIQERVKVRRLPTDAAVIEAAAFASHMETTGAPSRVAAAVEKDIAQILDARDGGERAWEAIRQALARDPKDPDLLLLSAGYELGRLRYLAALDKLERVVACEPGNEPAQEMLLHLLVGQDRLQTARTRVDALRATLPGMARLPLLDAWISAIGLEDLAATEQALTPWLAAHPTDPEAQWLLGYAQVSASDVRALSTLESASKAISEAATPDTRVLTAEILATWHLAGAEGRDKMEIRILTLAPREPWVYLLLARSYEKAGRLHSAQAYLDQAAVMAPRLARVQYERGRFYLDVLGDRAVAVDAWKAYQELGPESARLARVQQVLGTTAP